MAYLDQFLRVIVKHGGSDLHIGEGEPPKMRVHGDIMPIRAEPGTREEAVQMLSLSMSSLCQPSSQSWMKVCSMLVHGCTFCGQFAP